MSSLHVLQIVADGAPGGGTTAVLGLCSDFIAQGMKVTLISQPNSYALQEAEKLGVRVEPFDFFTSRFDFTIAGRLKGMVRAISPDIIHAHGGRAANSFWQPAFWADLPLVYTVHGYHFLGKKPPLRWFSLLSEFAIARRVSKIVFVAESERALALEMGIAPSAGRTCCIRNGVDPKDFLEGAGVPKQYDLVFAGRMHRQKNPLFVIDIVAALAEQSATLLMIGDGPLLTSVKAHAEKMGVAGRITFTGALPRAETLKALHKARIYLLPSLWEGLPIGPIEAMFCGLPVVASRVKGTDEVVVDQVTGRLVENFDAELYRQEIAGLLRDEAALQAMGLKAQQIARTNFDRNVNTQRHLELYREMVTRR